MTLADRIVVLNGGRIEQVGTPVDLYQRPCNAFVAGFIGSPAMNFIDVDMAIADERIRLVRQTGGSALPVAFHADGRTAPGPAKLGVRPESLKLASAETALFSGTVDVVEYLGEVTIIYLHLDDGGATVLAKLEGAPALRKGDHLHLTAAADHLHGFDGEGLALRRV